MGNEDRVFFFIIGVLSLIFIFEIFSVSVRMRVYHYLRVFEVTFFLGGGGYAIFFTFSEIGNENHHTVKKMFRVA